MSQKKAIVLKSVHGEGSNHIEAKSVSYKSMILCVVTECTFNCLNATCHIYIYMHIHTIIYTYLSPRGATWERMPLSNPLEDDGTPSIKTMGLELPWSHHPLNFRAFHLRVEIYRTRVNKGFVKPSIVFMEGKHHNHTFWIIPINSFTRIKTCDHWSLGDFNFNCSWESIALLCRPTQEIRPSLK